MDEKKKNLLYKALAVTFCIMFLSLFFSQIIYESRFSRLDKGVNDLRNEINEEKLFMAFSDEFSKNASVCGILDSYLSGLSDRVFETGKKIEKFASDETDLEQVKIMQKDWVYLNLELWLRLLKYNKICAQKKKSYILYFYPYKCLMCAPYSAELNRLNEKYGDSVWLFSIPAEIDIKMVRLMIQYFGIKKTPAIIVDGKLLAGDDVLGKLEKSIRKDSVKTQTKKRKTK